MLINASDLGAFTATGGTTGGGAFLGMVLATFLAEFVDFDFSKNFQIKVAGK